MRSRRQSETSGSSTPSRGTSEASPPAAGLGSTASSPMTRAERRALADKAAAGAAMLADAVNAGLPAGDLDAALERRHVEPSSAVAETASGSALKPSEELKLDLIQGGPRAGTKALIAREGDTITLTKGREVLQPFSYNVFEVGPIALTVHIREGESFADAYVRASVALEELFEAEFEIRLKSFRDHVTQARKST